MASLEWARFSGIKEHTECFLGGRRMANVFIRTLLLSLLTKPILESRAEGIYFQYSVIQSLIKSQSQIASWGPGGDSPLKLPARPAQTSSTSLLVF